MAEKRQQSEGEETHFEWGPGAILNWAFLRELNDNIRSEVRDLGPTYQGQTMEQAKKIERKWGTMLWTCRKLGGKGDSRRLNRRKSCVEENPFNSALKQKIPNSSNPNFANYPNFANPNFQGFQSRIQLSLMWSGYGQAAN